MSKSQDKRSRIGNGGWSKLSAVSIYGSFNPGFTRCRGAGANLSEEARLKMVQIPRMD